MQDHSDKVLIENWGEQDGHEAPPRAAHKATALIDDAPAMPAGG